MSQDSQLSSGLLSPNRVCQDRDVPTEDLYPLFDASPLSEGHLSLISPVTSWGSTLFCSEEDAESFHNAGISPATLGSLYITHWTAELQLLSLPPALVSATSSCSAIDPARNRSHPAGLAHHGLSGVASSASARSCASLASISVLQGAF